MEGRKIEAEGRGGVGAARGLVYLTAYLGSEFWRKFSRAKFLLTAAGVRQLFKDLKTCQRRRRCRHATFWGSKEATSVALPKTWEIFVACRKRRIGADVAAASAAQLPIARKVKCLPSPPSVHLSACLSGRQMPQQQQQQHRVERSASQRIHVQFPQGKTSTQLKWQFQIY